MKADFLSGINNRLFTVPVLLILLAYLAIGIWFYSWGSAYLLEDFHAAQLVTMLSDKRSGVELWFDARKKAVDDISQSDVVADNLKKILRAQDAPKDASEKELKKLKDVSAEAGQQISKYLAGFSQFRTVSFLTKKGNVIWSGNADLINRPWPDKDVFAKGTPPKPIAVIGKTALSGAEELFFTAALSAGGQDNEIRVIAQPNPADLAASLRVEKGFYETGKVSIIDGNGSVVAATDMTEPGKVRYNVRPGGLEGVGYRNGLFYSVVLLRSEPLRLIATLDAAEAAKPLKPLRTIYFSFAVFIIAVILIQIIFIAPKVLGKPVTRLLKATQAIGEGEGRQVNLRKGFAGELKMLAEGFSQMIVALSRKSPGPNTENRIQEINRQKVLLSDAAASEIRARLDRIDKIIEYSDSPENNINAAVEIKSLLMTMDDLNEVARLWDGPAKTSKKECGLCDILSEIEGSCRSLIEGKELELIIECPQTIASRQLDIEGKTLKRLAASLLRNAIRHTEIGTVTMMPSFTSRDGGEFLELTVSDTGIGVDNKAAAQVLKKGVYFSPYLELIIAREMTEYLGGKIGLDSMQGKGTLVTVDIPLMDRLAETSEVL